MDHDERFMRAALGEARRAGDDGEVPVGAVVALGGEIVGRGRNRPVGDDDPTAHAEIVALRDAGRRVGNYRLTGAVLYCTVEPCLMCVGAALHARVERVVWGAPDEKVGATGAVERLRETGAVFNHRFDVLGGVLASESAELLRGFFAGRRDGRTGGGGIVATAAHADCGEVPKWS